MPLDQGRTFVTCADRERLERDLVAGELVKKGWRPDEFTLAAQGVQL